MSGRFDVTLMYAMHNALRPELEHIAKVTARAGDDPRRVLASAADWAMFKNALHIHHGSEDDAPHVGVAGPGGRLAGLGPGRGVT